MFQEDMFKRWVREALREELFKSRLIVHRDQQAVAVSSKEIYTVGEAARYLNMAVPTLRVKYTNKIIGYIQEGRKILFKKAHLDAYLDKFTRHSK